MKARNYSIRISDLMAEHLTNEGRKKAMLPSEYLRYIIQKDMDEKERERKYQERAGKGEWEV